MLLPIAVQIALLIMLTVTLVPILQYQAPADYAVCQTPFCKYIRV